MFCLIPVSVLRVLIIDKFLSHVTWRQGVDVWEGKGGEDFYLLMCQRLGNFPFNLRNQIKQAWFDVYISKFGELLNPCYGWV